MKSSYKRALLAGLIGLGIVVSLARADGQSPPPPVVGSYPIQFNLPMPAGDSSPWAGQYSYNGAGPGGGSGCAHCNGGGYDAGYAGEVSTGRSPLFPRLDVAGHWEHFVGNVRHATGTDCWSNVNYMGCGSLHQEVDFIFGACRFWYGEPCYKGPPTPPVQLFTQEYRHYPGAAMPYQRGPADSGRLTPYGVSPSATPSLDYSTGPGSRTSQAPAAPTIIPASLGYQPMPGYSR